MNLFEVIIQQKIWEVILVYDVVYNVLVFTNCVVCLCCVCVCECVCVCMRERETETERQERDICSPQSDFVCICVNLLVRKHAQLFFH